MSRSKTFDERSGRRAEQEQEERVSKRIELAGVD